MDCSQSTTLSQDPCAACDANMYVSQGTEDTHLSCDVCDSSNAQATNSCSWQGWQQLPEPLFTPVQPILLLPMPSIHVLSIFTVLYKPARVAILRGVCFSTNSVSGVARCSFGSAMATWRMLATARSARPTHIPLGHHNFPALTGPGKPKLPPGLRRYPQARAGF